MMYVCYEKPELAARYRFQCLRLSAGTVSARHEASRVLLLIPAGLFECDLERGVPLIYLLCWSARRHSSSVAEPHFIFPTTGSMLPASQFLRCLGQRQCWFCVVACCAIDRTSDLRLDSPELRLAPTQN